MVFLALPNSFGSRFIYTDIEEDDVAENSEGGWDAQSHRPQEKIRRKYLAVVELSVPSINIRLFLDW